MENRAMKWSEPEVYVIRRNKDEKISEFHTRVANEIQTMRDKIVQAEFMGSKATIWTSELITNRMMY